MTVQELKLNRMYIKRRPYRLSRSKSGCVKEDSPACPYWAPRAVRVTEIVGDSPDNDISSNGHCHETLVQQHDNEVFSASAVDLSPASLLMRRCSQLAACVHAIHASLASNTMRSNPGLTLAINSISSRKHSTTKLVPTAQLGS
jgi:hypothetical protein